MKQRMNLRAAGSDETTRGLAILLAVLLLAAGVVEFAVERPRPTAVQPAVFVYEGVNVLAPQLTVRGKVNVNTAVRSELVKLRGIGEALAGRIIAHRESEGPFNGLDDLVKVQGIGPATIDGFRDQACVADEVP